MTDFGDVDNANVAQNMKFMLDRAELSKEILDEVEESIDRWYNTSPPDTDAIYLFEIKYLIDHYRVRKAEQYNAHRNALSDIEYSKGS